MACAPAITLVVVMKISTPLEPLAAQIKKEKHQFNGKV